jgi:hypothetical protein
LITFASYFRLQLPEDGPNWVPAGKACLYQPGRVFSALAVAPLGSAKGTPALGFVLGRRLAVKV